MSPSRNFQRFRDAPTDSELRVRGHYTEFCEIRLGVVICSDSFAALSSLKSGKSSTRQEILSDILQSLFRIQTKTVISFIWIPAHIGIGNEVVDQIAKKNIKTSRYRI